MQFDHSKLLGRIVEKFGTQKALCAHIGWAESKLSARLNNLVHLLSLKDTFHLHRTVQDC